VQQLLCVAFGATGLQLLVSDGYVSADLTTY